MTRKMQPGRDPHAVPGTPVMSITVWSLAHPVAVTGHIELDGGGMPVRVHKPGAVIRPTH